MERACRVSFCLEKACRAYFCLERACRVYFCLERACRVSFCLERACRVSFCLERTGRGFLCMERACRVSFCLERAGRGFVSGGVLVQRREVACRGSSCLVRAGCRVFSLRGVGPKKGGRNVAPAQQSVLYIPPLTSHLRNRKNSDIEILCLLGCLNCLMKGIVHC